MKIVTPRPWDRINNHYWSREKLLLIRPHAPQIGFNRSV